MYFLSVEWRFSLILDDESVVVEPPLEWDETEFVLRRDPKAHGVFFDYAPTVKFVCAARKRIWNAYQTGGVDAVVFFRVEYACGKGFQPFFFGRLALPTLTLNESEGWLGVAVEDAGAFAKFNQRRDWPVDVLSNVGPTGDSLPEYERLPTYVDAQTGPPLLKTALLEASEPLALTLTGRKSVGQGIGCTGLYFEFWAATGFDRVVGDETGGVQAQAATGGAFFDDECGEPLQAALRPPVLFIAQESGVHTLEICDLCFELFAQADSNLSTLCDCFGDDYDTYNDFCSVRFELVLNGETLYDSGELYSPHAGDAPEDNRVTHTGCLGGPVVRTLDLQAGEPVSFHWRITVYGNWRKDLLYNPCVNVTVGVNMDNAGCCLRLQLESRATLGGLTLPVAPVHEAFARLCDALSDNELGFRSEFFGRSDLGYDDDGCGAYVGLANGLMVRGFPTASAADPGACAATDPPINQSRRFFLSFSALFDNLSAIFNLGMGLESDGETAILRVEPYEHFYPDSPEILFFDLDPVEAQIERRVLHEHLFNEAVFGYRTWESESANGLWEYNAVRRYVTPLRTVKNRLERRCDFVASQYAWEKTRRKNFRYYPTEDFLYDESVFVVALEPGNLTQIERGVALAGNVFAPGEAMNFRLSPSTHAARWVSVVGTAMTFAAGEANFTAFGEEANPSCSQGFRHEDRSFPDPAVFLLSEELRFKAPLSAQKFISLRENPYWPVRVRYGNVVVAGHIVEIRYRPADLSSFRLRLRNE